MKTTLKITLALAAMAMILVAACSKYEEGPKLSLRSKKARLAGEWKVDKYFLNGTDITSQMMQSGDSYTMTINKDGTWTSTFTSGSFSSTDKGTWEFVEKKEMLKTVTDGSTDTDGDTATIAKLKNKELWIDNHYGTDHFRTQMVPK